ncbi:MAG TPA: serine/threonine protein kinase, partial [Burkholderiales bacterium]|nr:serine/threonine protein kinase [Burkholderiales bacterium]
PAEAPRPRASSVPVWASTILVVSVLLLALGYWTYRAVEGSLRELRAATMKSLLDSQANALRVWIAEETADADRIAREPRVRDAVAKLSRSPQCSGPARAQLEEVLRPLLRDVGDATFNLTDRRGRLIATRFPDYCGRSLTRDFFAQLAPVFEGTPRFVRPYGDRERVADAPQVRRGPPFAWVVAPVRDAAGEVIAALGVAEPVDAVFASIVQAARPGETGEAFAFDQRGAILTAERFGELSPLHGKGDGVVLEPYMNHRGAKVIGAARWLPEYGMGVAIEMEATEAYAPLRYLNIAFGVVFGALVIAVFAALVSAASVIRLRRQVGETRRLGAYVLQRRIGEGGMANVYLARHALLKRPTAVKLLKPARATDEMIARFEREVQLASSLSHPNTVEIFDFGRTRDGLFYYAMEYLDGLTVSEVIARSGALPVSRTVHLLRQACAALAEAHGKGLVHRDVKPENVMVCRYGGAYDFVKILDFGLVKSVGAKHSRDLTRNLRILGTPLYMAPERLRNPADVDARADIYAVGALAYLMLTGRNMLEAADDLEMTSRILNEEPARVSAVAPQAVPLELDLVVTACVEKRREDRPQRIADLVEAFEALGADFPWTQREAQAWWNNLPERELA